MNTLIHIGYPKCASTFLKRFYLSTIAADLVVPRGKLLDSVMGPVFDLEKTQTLLEEHGIDKHLVDTVFTNEALSGSTFWEKEGAFETASALYKIQPKAKILIIIREQRDYIESAYKYAVCHGQYLQGYEHFVASKLTEVTEKLSYDALISAYMKLFGQAQVLVLPVEFLRRDRSGFENALREFHDPGRKESTLEVKANHIEMKANKSSNNWRFIERVRRLNVVLKFIYKIEMRYLKPRHHNLRKDSFSFYKAIVKWIEDAHEHRSIDVPERVSDSNFIKVISASNRRTEEITGIDLRKLGYL